MDAITQDFEIWLICNLFVQMSDIMFTANQKVCHTFPMGSHKNLCCTDMHFFTFTDTDCLPIPVTDIPIFTDILQFFRTGEEEEQKIT